MSPLKRFVLSLFVTQVLFFIISVSADKSPTAPQLPISSKPVVISKNVSNGTNVAIDQAMEGGGHVNVSLPSNITDTKKVITSTLLGREHEVIVKDSKQTINVATSPGRTIPTVEELPDSDIQGGKDNVKHNISGRKDANNTEPEQKVKDVPDNVTSTIEPLKKPNVTIPGEVDPSESAIKLNASVKTEVPSNVLNSRSQESTQKYVVPIVIVILSVPFVAIIISILYKRGAEWWRYRHYRRMDFLINGMYDN